MTPREKSCFNNSSWIWSLFTPQPFVSWSETQPPTTPRRCAFFAETASLGSGPWNESGDMTLYKRRQTQKHNIYNRLLQSVLMEENMYCTDFIRFRECAESNRLSCITWHYRCIPRQWSELNISWHTKNHVPLPLQSNTLHVVGSRVVRKCHEQEITLRESITCCLPVRLHRDLCTGNDPKYGECMKCKAAHCSLSRYILTYPDHHDRMNQ